MKDKVNLKALLTGLSMLGALVAAGVVIVLIRAPGDVAPALPSTVGMERPVGGGGEDSSGSENVPNTSTPGVEREETATPDAAPLESSRPEIDDPPSPAELEDLQFIADQKGISLEEAIDRYAWNDNFSLAVSRIREASPETFAGAEIVDGANAWIGFTERPPEAALAIIELFRSSHSGVSVEVSTDQRVTEAELQDAIPAVHYAVSESPEVRDAVTGFDSATGQIRSIVVLESTASDSILDDLRAIATERLIAVTRPDILDSISVSVVISESPVLSGVD